MGASLLPEWYKENINVAILLAPIGRLDHTTAPFMKLMSNPLNVDASTKEAELVGYYDVFSPNPYFAAITGAFCSVLTELCSLAMAAVCETDPNIDNMDRIKTYTSFFPSGAGYELMTHYG